MDENNKEKFGVDHFGHRIRLKDKLTSIKENVLAQHELLEMMLFYSLPRRNTNHIAHELMERFGDLEHVLKADISELEDFDQIKKNSIVLMKAILEVEEREFKEEKNVSKAKGYEDFADIIWELCKGMNEYGMYAICVRNDGEILLSFKLKKGISTKMFENFLKRNVLELDVGGVFIFRYTDEKVVIPSLADLEYVKGIENMFKTSNMNFLEYFIVSKEGTLGVRGKNVYDSIVNGMKFQYGSETKE